MCLFGARVNNNDAIDGTAIYQQGGCIYINRFPDRLGADCGPEPVTDLGSVRDWL